MLRATCIILGISALNAQAADVTVRPALSFSKHFGGSGNDSAGSVTVDGAGNVYVAGTTNSNDFPTASAFQPALGGAPLRITADGGKTWTSPAIPYPVYSVAASSQAPATIYAGTRNGIYRSVDSGKTWGAPAGAGGGTVNALAADSAASTTVYAATSTGLLKSTDSGMTWKAMGPAGYGLALAANPARPGTLIAAFNRTSSGASLYRSSDSGGSWTLLSASPVGPIALAFDAATPNLLYAAASTTGFAAGGVISIYKSSDGGDTWSKLTAPSPVLSTFALAAGAGKVYVGTANGLQVSGDGGLSWRSAAGVAGSVGNIAVDPTSPQSVYVAGDGIFASTDSGATWSRISSLRQTVQMVAVAPTAPPTVFVGAERGHNVFVTKWSADGKQMLYSTYLGGSYDDGANAIAVDRQGNAYVVGRANSTDFPVTAGALQPANRGAKNGFLAKISPDGKTLLYSTYLGGSLEDSVYAVAVDNAGNAYVTGAADSSDFPVTTDAFQTHKQKSCANSAVVPGIQSAAFVSKIATDGGGLRYSTFLGGTCPDEGAGIAIDASGSAYVVGPTGSADFPVTQGSLQPKWGGGSVSGFLAKLTPQGSGLVYSTFIGGRGQDAAVAVAVDDKGAAYVAGGSWGLDELTYAPGIFNATSPVAIVPTSDGVGFGVTLGGAGYVAKVDAAGSNRLYLKYLGGTGGYARTIALDRSGNAWTTGYFSKNSSERFPMAHPFQAETGSTFVSELAPDGHTLLFSSAIESASEVAVDADGNAFVAGWTLPVTTSKKDGGYATLTRIDGAVASAVTVEDPLGLVRGGDAPVDYGIAPGEFLVLTGTGLGPTVEAAAQVGSDGELPTSLANTKVTFGGVAAPLLSVQAEKIVCIAPFSVASKGATLQVESGGSLSNSIVLPAATTAIQPFGLVNEDGSINAASHPAAPGSIVTMYAAGLGQTTPASVDGQVNDAGLRRLEMASDLEVQVSGQTAPILYAGSAPGQVAGVSQINFRVPQIAPGTYTVYLGWGPSSPTRPFLGDYNSLPLVVGQP